MNNKQKEIIIEGVRAAGKKIKDLIGVIDTNSITKVTSFDYGIPADIISEKIILQAIKDSKLNCEIIAEESKKIRKGGVDYTVYLDPLDGTVNFSKGIPIFCIGLGIYYHNKPFLGVIYDISREELFVAEIGKGVTVNGRIIKPRVSKSHLLINVEWFGAAIYEKIISKLRQQDIQARTIGSGILALCYGSIGRGDGAILVGTKPWDVAPGMVFAQEMECITKQLDGKKVDLNLPIQNVIAAPRVIFDKINGAVSTEAKI